MHVLILSSTTGWHIDELTRAVRARGLEAVVLPWEGNVSPIGGGRGVTNGGRDFAEARAILPRIIPSGSLEQIIYRVDTLHRLEEDGVRVMNSARAIERTVDKSWTSAILAGCRPRRRSSANSRRRLSKPGARSAATWWSSRCSDRWDSA